MQLRYVLAVIAMIVCHSSHGRTYDLRLDGTNAQGEGAGSALAAGDMDGDGLADLAVASPYFPGNNSGLVRVVRGTKMRLPPVDTLADVAASNIVGTEGLWTGTALAFGDFNADGYSDLAMSQPYAPCDDPGWFCGAIQVVYGSNSLPGDLQLTDSPSGSVIRYFGTQGYPIGRSLGGCDINGDGVEDLVIGGPESQIGAGSLYVVYGRPQTAFGNTVRLDSLSPDMGFRVDGIKPYQGAGAAIACLHSPNEKDVLVIGSRMQYSTFVHTAVWLLHDLRTPVQGVVELTPSPNVFEIDEDDGAGFTNFGANLAVSDVNGDGCEDLAIAAPWDGDILNGKVYILYGCTLMYSSQIMFKSQITGTAGFHISGAGGDSLGDSSIVGGDFDGDGFGDIAMGSIYSSEPNGICKQRFGDGIAYILHGSKKSKTDDVSASTLDCVTTSHTEWWGGWSTFALAVGDFDGNGLIDIASGAPYGGPYDGGSVGAVYFCYSGTDDLPSAARAYFCNPTPSADQTVIFKDAFD